MQELTCEYLKSVLKYDKNTGDFIWIKRTAQSVRVGNVAGGLNANGYLRISLLNKKRLAHRLAWLYMTGEWPKHEVDHINHKPWDNRWSNLRGVTHQENCKNQKLRSTNKSGFTGVFRNKNKWRSEITINGKNVFLGDYNTIYGALVARKMAEKDFSYHENHGVR